MIKTVKITNETNSFKIEFGKDVRYAYKAEVKQISYDVEKNTTTLLLGTNESDFVSKSIDIHYEHIMAATLTTMVGVTDAQGVALWLKSYVDSFKGDTSTTLTEILAVVADIEENTSYQDVPFSAEKTVTTAGTAEAITAITGKGWVTIKALGTNTDTVYIGASDVASTNGYPLDALDSLTVSSDNLSEWYVDSAVDGEGIRIIGAYIG